MPSRKRGQPARSTQVLSGAIVILLALGFLAWRFLR